jgi:hypothetical protein
VCNLGHGGLPCPGLGMAEEEENTRQDAEWERHLNSQPHECSPVGDTSSTGGGCEGTASSASHAAPGENYSALLAHGIGMTTPPSGGMGDAALPPGAHATTSQGEDFIAPADLDLHMNAAVQDIFDDEYGAPDQDESYDSDGIDAMEDPEVPDGDIEIDNCNDQDDCFTQKHYEQMQGIATPPHPDPEDALGNPFVTFIETNGVHHLPIHYCICPSARPHDEQLFASKLFPSTFSSIKTVFTFNVLDDF